MKDLLYGTGTTSSTTNTVNTAQVWTKAKLRPFVHVVYCLSNQGSTFFGCSCINRSGIAQSTKVLLFVIPACNVTEPKSTNASVSLPVPMTTIKKEVYHSKTKQKWRLYWSNLNKKHLLLEDVCILSTTHKTLSLWTWFHEEFDKKNNLSFVRHACSLVRSLVLTQTMSCITSQVCSWSASLKKQEEIYQKRCTG